MQSDSSQLSYQGKTYAVVGLGLSGLATCTYLQAAGAQVFAWDDGERARTKAKAADIPLQDLRFIDWSSLEALILSPGVPLTHPEPHWAVKLAQQHSVPIIGDLDLFAAQLPDCATMIAITGTNGKSTTTALIGHILKSAGLVVEVGGNIGTPFLELSTGNTVTHYVLELSSYQLDLYHGRPFDHAVLLNISPDHLDRHGDLENYTKAKLRIFRSSPEKSPVSYRDFDLNKLEYQDLLEGAHLLGEHNLQNAVAAYEVCIKLGLKDGDIRAALKTFPGLPHRMEVVTSPKPGSITFVNDSKATNGEAAAKALACYENIHWIVGGLSKADGLEPISQALYPKIAGVYLFGQDRDRLGAQLKGALPFHSFETLDEALAAAVSKASAEGEDSVVLLSPACASFDQYENFERRGEAFKELVAKLP